MDLRMYPLCAHPPGNCAQRGTRRVRLRTLPGTDNVSKRLRIHAIFV